MKRSGQRLLCAAIALTLAACGQSQSDGDGSALVAADAPPLENEQIGKSESLEGKYEDDWFFAHDVNFNTLVLGKVMVIDAGDGTLNYRGAIDAAQMATFNQSSKRKELYVAETYYERGTRGKRTDVMTIWDRETLKPKGEVILPNNNRAQNVTQKAGLSLTANQKFALIYTFTPATGVAVIDLDSRKLVNEIDTGGCILAYPAGDQGFASLCGDGKMASFALSDSGQVAERTESAAFNDIDNNPLFTMSTTVGDVTYFPTFEGYLQGVQLGDGAPKPQEAWHFADGTDRKPSGWQMITGDAQGRVYVLMRAGAKPGDHKYGGDEVWVLDPKARKVVRKIKLEGESISIEVSHAAKPIMLVTNGSMELEVYDLASDKKVRSIGGFMAAMPMVLHAFESGR
ncbi:MAG: amine dehydrogenase [Alphaproteobacteria bacterium]|nr:MAG: amine dehydrogenase [Alphaproteobacteria bacterium]